MRSFVWWKNHSGDAVAPDHTKSCHPSFQPRSLERTPDLFHSSNAKSFKLAHNHAVLECGGHAGSGCISRDCRLPMTA